MLASIACGTTSKVVVVTATPKEAPATQTPLPSETPPPTLTPTPTTIPTPTMEVVTISEVEAALTRDGWKRSPVSTAGGGEAFSWAKGNIYEPVTTFSDGSIGMEVLNTHNRQDDMESRFKLLDTVFPEDFMAQLREQNKQYDASAGLSVSGKPDDIQYPPGGAEWKEYHAYYNTSDVRIGPYNVRFQLHLWHLTCPSPYGCYMQSFPGQEWTGDTGFTWYTITIQLPQAQSSSGTS
jgi:hypothetical protein